MKSHVIKSREKFIDIKVGDLRRTDGIKKVKIYWRPQSSEKWKLLAIFDGPLCRHVEIKRDVYKIS